MNNLASENAQLKLTLQSITSELAILRNSIGSSSQSAGKPSTVGASGMTATSFGTFTPSTNVFSSVQHPNQTHLGLGGLPNAAAGLRTAALNSNLSGNAQSQNSPQGIYALEQRVSDLECKSTASETILSNFSGTSHHDLENTTGRSRKINCQYWKSDGFGRYSNQFVDVYHANWSLRANKHVDEGHKFFGGTSTSRLTHSPC